MAALAALAGCDDDEQPQRAALAAAGSAGAAAAGASGQAGGGQGGGGGEGAGAAGGSGQGGQGGGGAGGGAGGAGQGGAALPEGVFPFGGVSVELPYDDLAPFGEMVGDASMVGLGEAVHTSGGFYAAKNRLIRYLIEQKGFRALAMETPRTDAEATGAYVATCQGTAKDAARGFFNLFADENTASLLEWLCAWNQQHPGDTVVFYGIDVQQPWNDAPALRAYLDKAVPGQAPALLDPIDASCDGALAGSSSSYYKHGPPVLDEADYQACKAAVAAARAWIDGHEAELIKASSADDLGWARIALLGLDSWEDEVYYTVDSGDADRVRDAAMAQVFEAQRTMAYPGRKTVLWAHNAHLRKQSDKSKSFPSFHALGSHLFDKHGDDYRPFGLSAYDTGINWPGVGCGPVAKPLKKSLEDRLHKLGDGDFLVDLAQATSGTAPLLTAGKAVDYGTDEKAALEEQFRGLVYLASSPGMKALFWGGCQLGIVGRHGAPPPRPPPDAPRPLAAAGGERARGGAHAPGQARRLAAARRADAGGAGGAPPPRGRARGRGEPARRGAEAPCAAGRAGRGPGRAARRLARQRHRGAGGGGGDVHGAVQHQRRQRGAGHGAVAIGPHRRLGVLPGQEHEAEPGGGDARQADRRGDQGAGAAGGRRGRRRAGRAGRAGAGADAADRRGSQADRPLRGRERADQEGRRGAPEGVRRAEHPR